MEDALGLMTLGDFLPVALQALDTFETFEVEISSVLQRYKSTCDKLRDTIQTTEDSPIQKAWKDITIDGKSWVEHLTTIQLYIKTLQVQIAKKKIETPLPQYKPPPPSYEP